MPVVILAVATRDVFRDSSCVPASRTRRRETATVAQRLVEDYATLQQRGDRRPRGLDDQIMVLVSRAIDQDVNLFDGARLQATSERDLFASQLLSTRTPADVYRADRCSIACRPLSARRSRRFRYLRGRRAGPRRRARRAS